MKKLKDQLKTIAKSLSSLSSQVEKISKEAAKLPPSQRAAAKKKSVKKTPARKAAKKSAAKRRAAPRAKAAVNKTEGRATVLDSVLAAIERSKNGANIETLREKTGLGARQLSNALYKLSKRGVITTKSRGVYVSK